MDEQGLELMSLQVVRAEQAAVGIRLFELRRQDGGDLPPFTPGAHLSVRTPSGAMRNYSLSSDPADTSRYVIAVKREEGGRGGSRGLVDRVAAGDVLDVSAPRNQFELNLAAPSYVFVAGGIGITPILSMIHAVRAAGKRFKLYYLTRNAEMTAFLPELSAPAMAGSVTIHHDNGDPAQAFDLWPVLGEPSRAHVYCCGPRPLMDAVRDMTGFWPQSQVHFEDFGAEAVRPRQDDTPFFVTFFRSGGRFEVPVGISILDVARAQSIRAPSSCESGTCGTCKTRLVSGEVDHRDMVLTPAERVDHLMVCVSRAKAGELVVDL